MCVRTPDSVAAAIVLLWWLLVAVAVTVAVAVAVHSAGVSRIEVVFMTTSLTRVEDRLAFISRSQLCCCERPAAYEVRSV